MTAANHADPLKHYLLLMNAPASVAVMDGPEHTFSLVNDNYRNLVGRSRELKGHTVREAFPDLEGQGFYELLDTVYATKTPYVGNEVPVMLSDVATGETKDIFVNFVYQPVVDSSGETTGVIVYATDVTDVVKTRKAADEARDRYKMVLESIDEGFCIIEISFDEKGKALDYTFIEANENFQSQTGLEDPVGKSARALVPGLEQKWFDMYGGVAKTGKAIQFTQGSDVMGRWFEVQATKVSRGEGNLVALLFKDVTAAKKAERELREQNMLVSTLTDNTRVSLCMIDKAGKITYMNPAAERATGHVLEDAIGESIHELFHHSYPDGTKYPEPKCPLYKAYRAGKPLDETQATFFRKDGSPFDVRISSTPIPGDSLGRSVVEFSDVSESQKVQAELQRIKRRYDALFNSKTVALATATTGGKVLEANQNFLDLFGYTKADIESGLTSDDLAAPSDVNGAKMYKAIIEKGESLPIERRYIRKDGTEFPALVGAVALPEDRSRYVGFIIDASENEQLKELNRTKDEFIALASHQLRTPVTAVKQYLGVVMEEFAGPLNADQLQYLNIANNANDRQLMIIEDLLKTAKIDTRGFGLTLTSQDLHGLVLDIIKQYRPMTGTKNQTISFTGGSKPVTVPFDKTEMTVAISNLVENASKYSPQKTVITLALSETREWAELRIGDQGVGISKKDQEKIFEKFTRIHNELSDTTSGSGLGLYWVKRIIDIHHGSLTIESKIGEGTTFIIRLRK